MWMVVDGTSWIGRNGKTFERQKLKTETRHLYRYEAKADGVTNRATQAARKRAMKFQQTPAMEQGNKEHNYGCLQQRPCVHHTFGDARSPNWSMIGRDGKHEPNPISADSNLAKFGLELVYRNVGSMRRKGGCKD